MDEDEFEQFSAEISPDEIEDILPDEIDHEVTEDEDDPYENELPI